MMKQNPAYRFEKNLVFEEDGNLNLRNRSGKLFGHQTRK